MAERERETVVVDGGGERRPSTSWVWAIVVVLVSVVATVLPVRGD